jgi:hypothetical protein
MPRSWVFILLLYSLALATGTHLNVTQHAKRQNAECTDPEFTAERFISSGANDLLQNAVDVVGALGKSVPFYKQNIYFSQSIDSEFPRKLVRALTGQDIFDCRSFNNQCIVPMGSSGNICHAIIQGDLVSDITSQDQVDAGKSAVLQHKNQTTEGHASGITYAYID